MSRGESPLPFGGEKFKNLIRGWHRYCIAARFVPTNFSPLRVCGGEKQFILFSNKVLYVNEDRNFPLWRQNMEGTDAQLTKIIADSEDPVGEALSAYEEMLQRGFSEQDIARRVNQVH